MSDFEYDFVVDEKGLLSPTQKRIATFGKVIDVVEIESDSECVHGLGPIACCVICNGRVEKERKANQLVRKEDGEVIIHYEYD